VSAGSKPATPRLVGVPCLCDARAFATVLWPENPGTCMTRCAWEQRGEDGAVHSIIMMMHCQMQCALPALGPGAPFGGDLSR